MRIYKIFVLLTLLLCAFSLSSCMKLEFSAEALMDAPMLTPEQIEIREALYDGLGTRNVKFKYPKEGEYRSAFIMHDLNGDGNDEALVFYDPQIGENQTWAGVLTKTAAGWVLNGGRSGKGSNVDSVAFCKMTAQDEVNIVVGWSGGVSNDKIIEVYSYNPDEDETLSQLIYVSYNDMLLYDINKDGLTELLLLRCNTLDGEATAQLVARGQDGMLKTSTSLSLGDGVMAFKRVQVGMLTKNIEAVFIDSALEDGKTSTNILSYDFEISKKMVNIINRLQEEDRIILKRSSAVYCEDFDGDGIIEVPCEPDNPYLPGYGEEYDGTRLTKVQYLRMTDDLFVPVWSGVANVDAGWRFELPDNWIDTVTVKVQPGTGEWRFFVYDISLENSYQQILRIGANNKSLPLDKNANEEYRSLGVRGMYEYRAFIPTEKIDKPFKISYEDVEKRFSILI
ncbi:MAG: hypothetical protein RRY14_05025 [Hydrogenoanaerobacterium sp.]